MRISGRREREKCFATTAIMRKSLAYRVMLRRGWSEVGLNKEWDYFWADVHSVGVDSGFDFSKLKSHQKLNHFQRHTELTRKDALVKNLKRAKKCAERESRDASAYDFLPQTFVLPQEYSMFADEFRRDPGRIWIMKPCGKSQGDGIFLINRIAQVFEWRRMLEEKSQAELYVISRYIEKPLLIGGKKFDIRLFVLVTSFSPLQVFLYRSGFCRFSCGQYSTNSLDDLKMHLTNTAIQKKQEGYNAATGMKWPLRSLRKYLVGTLGGERADEIFKRIQDVVVHSLVAVQHVVTADRRCFELFGYDVLLDEDMKPWLIEVNASPSLSATTAADYELKTQMLDDTLTLLEQMGDAVTTGFDLVWSGRQEGKPHSDLRSLLGCRVPRKLF